MPSSDAKETNVVKKIKIWWLGLLIDYHKASIDECNTRVLIEAKKRDAHRVKRDNLEARLTRVFYS